MKKLIVAAIIVLFTLTSFAQIKLPKVIANNMVLQLNQAVPIWGLAKPNEIINVNFKDQQRKAIVAANTIRNFSAIGYCIARNLNRELNVPIGILQSAWGGKSRLAYNTLLCKDFK